VEPTQISKFSGIIFFDRDGTLIEEIRNSDGSKRSAQNTSEMKYYEGIHEIILYIKKLNFAAVVITNQPEISRGNLSLDSMDKMNKKLIDELEIDLVLFCPHDKLEKCDCRKPHKKLLDQATYELHFSDKQKMLFVGDRITDMLAAKNFSIQGIHLDFNLSCTFFDHIHSKTISQLFEEVINITKI
jgi:histidinol-phosphate phosphatase family protein